MREKIKFVEVPPFDSFVIEGSSPRTFGLKDFFTNKERELEIVVSENSKVEIIKGIINQEKGRSSLDSILQGVGGAGTSGGIVATAGAIASCPACYPLYASMAPLAMAGASLLVIPAGYGVIKRLGQRKVMKSLAETDSIDVNVCDYSPFLETIKREKLSKHVNNYDFQKSLPRAKRDKVLQKESKLKAHEILLSLEEQANKVYEETDHENFKTLAQAYGTISKRYGKNKNVKPCVILKPVKYEKTKKRSIALAAAGTALLLTGGILWGTDTNPLDYIVNQPTEIVNKEVTYHTDILNIEGMDCKGCVKKLEKRLEKNPAIFGVSIDYEASLGKIRYNSSQMSHEQLLNLFSDPYLASIKRHGIEKK